MKIESWKTVRLGDLCGVSMGKTPSRSNKDFWDPSKSTNNVWVSIADLTAVQGKEISNSKEYVSDSGAKLFKAVPKGTLLASFKLSLGKLAFAGTDLRTNEAIAAFKNDESEVLNEYLYYFLTFFDWDDYAKEDHKVKGKTLNKEKVENIEIHFPTDKKEQKRIVKILDEKFGVIEELKRVTEQQITDAKELFVSRLNEVFKNEVATQQLDQICDITSSKRVYAADYVSAGIPFYRTKEIKELAHNIKPSTELFISKEKYLEISNRFGAISEGDLLLTAIGTIGEMYIVQNSDEFYFKDGNVLWLKNMKNVTTEYLKYALECFVKEIQSLSNGSAYQALTIERLQKHLVPVPNLEIQNRIVDELDELSKKTKELESIFRRKIADLDELKKSYLEQAFRAKCR